MHQVRAIEVPEVLEGTKYEVDCIVGFSSLPHKSLIEGCVKL